MGEHVFKRVAQEQRYRNAPVDVNFFVEEVITVKKRLISLLISMCTLLSLMPVAIAAEADTPYVTDYSILINGVEYKANNNEVGKVVTIPGSTKMETFGLSMTVNEPVTFIPNTNPPAGSLYVRMVDTNNNTAYLNLNATVNRIDMNIPSASIAMGNPSGNTWSGTIKFSDFTQLTDLDNVPFFSVANSLESYNPMHLLADSIQSSSGVGNEATQFVFNQDSKNVYVLSFPADTAVYTITYITDSVTYVWELPAGSPILLPEELDIPGETFKGWYTDAEYSTEFVKGTLVTGDTTLYAKYDIESSGESFEEQIKGDSPILTINNLNDFNVFASQASEISADRRVQLGADINCSSNTYTAIQFTGDFDGQNHTISNAVFEPNGSNAGMLASIGEGQIIANLKMSNITVNYATNAGVLAGSISARTGDTPTANRPLIQNIQISDCSVSGQNSGGLVGYTFISIIQYCSVSNTTVSGFVNAGGIAAQSYSNINNCYTVGVNLSAFFKGGIVGVIPEAGSVSYCWTTYDTIIGRDTGYTPSNCLTDMASRNFIEITENGFNPDYWNITYPGTNMTFTSRVVYNFSPSES